LLTKLFIWFHFVPFHPSILRRQTASSRISSVDRDAVRRDIVVGIDDVARPTSEGVDEEGRETPRRRRCRRCASTR